MSSIKTYPHFFVFIALLLCGLQASYSQTTEQKNLEAKRERLQNEIREINRLLYAEKKEKGNVLDQMNALDKKISVRQQLIRVTNEQSNLLNRQLNANVRNISKLKNELTTLKEDYALMIQKSYQNKSKQSRLMFLLSSESFFQGFKRLQYMKQYTKFRKEQGEQILSKTEELNSLNETLIAQRKTKDLLIAENTAAKKELEIEKKTQNTLLSTIRKNESKYTATIKQKEKEARKIDKQIEGLIKSAIVSSNKKAGNTTKSDKFVLTPEATVIANNFSSNKGKLIWPVEKGIKSIGFGVYNDAVYPGIKHQNNGVIIATDQGAKARAIFEGEVIAVISVPGGNKGVQIKHGNYISTYYNLSSVYVTKGDHIKAKAALGEVFTNTSSNQTLLKFYLYQDTSRLNPEEWIYKL
ncbi:peptidoglycan DD-metalloendopeptidase family protein [Cellulophaga baltica]|jgi:septal ring factor EnvC (AmiA/AmiB activator)|uniref:murein hydrolase activator EnvC family protein n=1 Tax=Cellulophaga TaxID=104264 RepID=UPI00051D606D|nr:MULTISPECIES: peptidoglycan DD-metalloendopeptidase family protein [Cellulophaga]KGK30459.1 peptidase M23 [Cellulophaga sp. E6(2014)]MCR1023218.1 peptidoglycan DD-metalloendopeptidase family protein [Cellulophaga baltica]